LSEHFLGKITHISFGILIFHIHAFKGEIQKRGKKGKKGKKGEIEKTKAIND